MLAEPTPITRAELAALRALDAPTISDAIEHFGVRDRTEGFTGSDIRCLTPELAPLVAYAVPAHVDCMERGPWPGKGKQTELWRMLERSPRPAVLVFEHPERGKLHGSVFGDVIAHIALRYGAIGCVSNGAVRDAAPTKRLGFQLFANGTVASHANNTTLRAGEEVTISGMRVRTGDLLFGDENGVVCIPRELRIADVLARCEAIKHSEAARIARAEAADFTLDEL